MIVCCLSHDYSIMYINLYGSQTTRIAIFYFAGVTACPLGRMPYAGGVPAAFMDISTYEDASVRLGKGVPTRGGLMFLNGG